MNDPMTRTAAIERLRAIHNDVDLDLSREDREAIRHALAMARDAVRMQREAWDNGYADGVRREREACALECDKYTRSNMDAFPEAALAAETCASRIRARGKETFRVHPSGICGSCRDEARTAAALEAKDMEIATAIARAEKAEAMCNELISRCRDITDGWQRVHASQCRELIALRTKLDALSSGEEERLP